MFSILEPNKPIIGIRQWRLTDDNLLLRGKSSSTEWVAGDNSAAAPKSGTLHVGLHGFAPHRADMLTANWYYVDEPLVTGVVIGWGNVCVHELGWRAQHARIVAISSFDALLREWEGHYKLRDLSHDERVAHFPGGEEGYTSIAHHYGVQTVDSLSGCVDWAASEGIGLVLPPIAHKIVSMLTAEQKAIEWKRKADEIRHEIETVKRNSELIASLSD